jgi:PleD family two-component response regulator
MQIRKRFGEILVEAGVITDNVLTAALQAQKKSGLALGRILEDMGAISDWDIATILARQFNLRAVQTISAPAIPENLLQVIDCDMAIKKNVFPLELKDGLLKLAISNPLDFDTLDKIAFKTALRIEPVLTTPTEIFKAIKRYYMQEESTKDSVPNKVLIVDENDLYRGTVCANIRNAGYQPFFADSTTAAIKLAMQENPHLILLSTTGNTAHTKMLIQTLQNNVATQNRPVIALSAISSPEEEAALLGMGFFDIIFKPLNYVRLLARIERTLRFFYHEQIPHS